ncbi:MAG: outer membrane protein assembly factor BamA [Alphaproteobacteria bacterium]
MLHRLNRVSFFIFFCLCLSFSTALFAEEGEGAQQFIDTISVSGAQRIPEATVVVWSTLKAGQSVTPEDLDRAVRKLYATDYFNDVYVRFNENTLKIYVEENPTIDKIAFEGNREIDDSKLSSQIGLKSKDIFIKEKVERARLALLKVYQKQGNYNAIVEPQIITLSDQNKVNIAFEIDEGETVNVQRITFLNNKAYPAHELENVIVTSETCWWCILSSTDTHDPERLDYDKYLLRQFYLTTGYPDFHVKTVLSEMTEARDNVFITFDLNEGERYAFGKIAIQSYMDDVNGEDYDALLEEMAQESGEWYNINRLEYFTKKITAVFANHGYAFVEVSPRVAAKNPDTKEINITYQVKEGKKISVGKINFFGNTRTKDEVLRREMSLIEGDSYNKGSLSSSRRKLNNLGYFSKVNVQEKRTEQADKVDLDVDVEETSTGEFNFGIGFSTVDDFITDLTLKENNLFGLGKKLALSTSFSGRKKEYDISYTEPYFLDLNVSAGADLFHITRDNQSESSHDETKDGFSLRSGYRINDKLTQSWRYTYRTTDITNVSDTASIYIQEQVGETTVSSVSQSLTYSTVDSRMDPHEGSLLRWSIDFAGLGGDEEFVRNKIVGKHYFDFGDDYVLGLTAQGGYISSLNGEPVSLSERFYLGGNSLKGFDVAGIGPRDISTGDALGGNLMYKAGLELAFPFPFVDDRALSLRLFSEAGTVTDVDASGADIVDSGSLRAAIGTGLVWRSPLGPLRFDFTRAIEKEVYDDAKNFRFSIGTNF